MPTSPPHPMNQPNQPSAFLGQPLGGPYSIPATPATP